MPVGETFAGFVIFHLTVDLFPPIKALLISNVSLQNCYSKHFTVNSYFPFKMQKFSPADVFPYTVLNVHSY